MPGLQIHCSRHLCSCSRPNAPIGEGGGLRVRHGPGLRVTWTNPPPTLRLVFYDANVVADPCVGQIAVVQDHQGMADSDQVIVVEHCVRPRSLPGRTNLVKVEPTSRGARSAFSVLESETAISLDLGAGVRILVLYPSKAPIP
jgi:hypothetical protein